MATSFIPVHTNYPKIFARKYTSSLVPRKRHRAGFLSLCVLRLFLHGNPDLALIIRVLRIRRRIDLKFHIFGVLILGTLGEELGHDSVIGFDEGVGHSSLAKERRTGAGRNGNKFQIIVLSLSALSNVMRFRPSTSGCT